MPGCGPSSTSDSMPVCDPAGGQTFAPWCLSGWIGVVVVMKLLGEAPTYERAEAKEG